MFGPRVVYGFRPNLQISFSSPFHITHGDHPTGRFTAMMPGIPEAEVLVGWRFYHATPGVSTRNEATFYAGGSATTQSLPRSDSPPLRREPALYVALATGRVARLTTSGGESAISAMENGRQAYTTVRATPYSAASL